MPLAREIRGSRVKDEPDFRVQGVAFRDSRRTGHVDGGWTESIVHPWPGYITWIAGLLIFGLAALIVLGISVCCPDVLLTPQKPSVEQTPSVCDDDSGCSDDVATPWPQFP
jgi:hypothetical protein